MRRRLESMTGDQIKLGVRMYREGYGGFGMSLESTLTLKQASAIFNYVDHVPLAGNPDDVLAVAPPERIREGIAECDRYIAKEGARNPTLRSEEVAAHLAYCIEHRERLSRILASREEAAAECDEAPAPGRDQDAIDPDAPAPGM